MFLAGACSDPAADAGPAMDPAKAAPAAAAGDPTVDAVDPAAAPQDTTLDIRVLGSNYDRGSTAQLALDGVPTPKVTTNSTRYKNSGELIANITVAADAPVAAYDVLVTTSRGKKGIGIEKFAVTEGPIPLAITMRHGLNGTDAVRADDVANTTYPTPAHVSGNGNLIFWLGDESPRAVRVTTTAFNGLTRRRIFTNNHTNPDGDDAIGLLGIVSGSAGTAVFEVELHNKASDPYDVVRYGKDCAGTGSGSGNVVPATKVTISRSADGMTWIVAGTGGVHCKQVTKKPGLVQVGTAGPFEMTMVRAP